MLTTKKTKLKNILNRYIILGIFSIFNLSSYGQSIDNLDKLNGFGNFKLGTSINIHKSDIKYVETTKEGLQRFKHINPNNISFLRRTPTNMSLTYYEGRLYDLFLSFNDIQGTVFRSLYSELEVLFGEPTESRPTITGNYFIKFEANKVELSMQLFSGRDKQLDHFVVEFRDLEISRALLTKQF